MDTKTSVAILYGGRSVEHEISIKSAVNVYQYINRDKHNAILIGIDKLGKWYLMQEVTGDFSEGTPLTLSLDAGAPAFINQQSQEQITVDVAFPVLHGTDGEDGSIQGLLKAMNIAFAGSGVLGSAVAMDKLVSKNLLFQAGIPVSKFLTVFKNDSKTLTFENAESKLGLPFIVKPVNLGSSVGITKVNNKGDFERAISTGFTYDHTLLIEEYISGRELECAVLGNKNAKASIPGEIIISDRYEFYSYEAKYEDESAVTIQIPADVETSLIAKMQALCVQAYQALQCEDYARVDLFLSSNGNIYINEINTIPGFTDVSMFPSLWAQHGISYPELIDQIIDLAMEGHTNALDTERSFK
jgi:D-alanine-D-alanine ligase